MKRKSASVSRSYSKVLFSPLQVPYSQRKVSTLSLQSTAACGVFDCLHDWEFCSTVKRIPLPSSTKMFSLVLPWQDTCIHCAWGHAQVLPLTGYLVDTKTSSSNYIRINLRLTGRENIMKQAVEVHMVQRLVLALQCWCDTRSYNTSATNSTAALETSVAPLCSYFDWFSHSNWNTLTWAKRCREGKFYD